MSRLQTLARKVLDREHENEHGANTVGERVHQPETGVNTLSPSNYNGLRPESERVHAFIPLVREQMNTLSDREHENEHGVNNACRHCGIDIDWRRGLGLAFADGAVAHMACDDAWEVGRLLAAGRRAVESADALTDPAEMMLRPGGLTP